MHRPRSRERRIRLPYRRQQRTLGPGFPAGPLGNAAQMPLQPPEDQPGPSRQQFPASSGLQQPSNPPPQVIKIPVKKLRQLQIERAAGTITTKEQTMAMFSEIPWGALERPARQTLPAFSQLHQQGKENSVAHRPRPFDPERNEYGSAKLIPWAGCARARRWIKKRPIRKVWKYDIEHVMWKTRYERLQKELRREQREPNYFEVQKLENFKKKRDKAAEVLIEEAQKAVVRMKEEEVDRAKQLEEQEEQKRKKYEFTLISPSQLYEVKEAMKVHHEGYLNLYKRQKQFSANRTAGHLKNFRMARATDNYTLEMPLAAPQIQMRIKTSSRPLSYEVTGLSTLEEKAVDWDRIWLDKEDGMDTKPWKFPSRDDDSIMSYTNSEANTLSPVDDMPPPVYSPQFTAPMEVEPNTSQSTWQDKMHSLIRKHNPEYGKDAPVTFRNAPASFDRKYRLKKARQMMAEFSKEPFTTRDRVGGQKTQMKPPKEHKRRTNTPETESQNMKETLSTTVVNQIEVSPRKKVRKKEKPPHIRQDHWEAMMKLKEKREQDAVTLLAEEEQPRPLIPGFLPAVCKQYVKTCAAVINLRAEQIATMTIPTLPLQFPKPTEYLTDSQATSPAIMEEQLDDSGEQRLEEVAKQLEKVAVEEGIVEENSTDWPVEEPSDWMMEEFVEIYSPEKEYPLTVATPPTIPILAPPILEELTPIVVEPAPQAKHPASPIVEDLTPLVIETPAAQRKNPALSMTQDLTPPMVDPAPQSKKFLVRDPKTQQLIPSSGAVVMKTSPSGPSTSERRDAPKEVEKRATRARDASSKTPAKDPSPTGALKTLPKPATPPIDLLLQVKHRKQITRATAGLVTQHILPQDFPPVTVKRNGRPRGSKTAPCEKKTPTEPPRRRQTRKRGREQIQPELNPPAEIREPLAKARYTKKSNEQVQPEQIEAPPKARNTKKTNEPTLLEALRQKWGVEEEEPAPTVAQTPATMLEQLLAGTVRVSSGSDTNSSSSKKSRRQGIREREEAIKEKHRKEEARKLEVELHCNSLKDLIMTEGKQAEAAARERRSKRATSGSSGNGSGNSSQQVSPLSVDLSDPPRNQESQRTSPVEVERSYSEISTPVETEFGTVFTSPRSQIPLESRFATDLAMAHPKSRTRRQAAIRRAEEEAQREATSSPATSILLDTPDVIQIDTAGPSRESSIAYEEQGSESSSVYLSTAPKKRLLRRVQTTQQLVEAQLPPAHEEVQLLPSPVRESSPEIIILDMPEKEPSEIKREQLEALEQASVPLPKPTDREYDEDGEDEPPLGYQLINAYDFMKIDEEELSADMVPFPPEAARVDGECFTHLLYKLVREEKYTTLPRLTNRYAPYSQDLLMFFASVSPRYLNEANQKLALENPAEVINNALNNLSDDAIIVLTRENNTAARKKQLVTSQKIKAIMTLFLQSRQERLEELGQAVYGKTDGPEYEKLKRQYDEAMNNIQLAICDNLMGLAEETKGWTPTINVLKRRFEAFHFGWRGFILRGGPLKCYSNMFQNNGMALEVHNTLELWFQRLGCLLDAISHDLSKEPIVRATNFVRLFEQNNQTSVQWDASLTDVRGEKDDEHSFGCSELCEVWFSRQDLQEKHEQLHQYKPFECSVDYLSFSHQVSLHLHYLHRHMKEVLNGEITVPPVSEFP